MVSDVTVKSIRGRRRYIVFNVPEETDRRGLDRLLSDLPQIRIIYCDEGMAVVRCSPADKEEVITRIVCGYPGSESLKTSGTLKTLRETYGSLGKGKKSGDGNRTQGMK